MPRYLSRQWFAEAGAAAGASRATMSGVSLTLHQVVTGTPEGDIDYLFRIVGGVVTVARDDRASDAADLDIDATFTQDYATAAALFRGDLTAQEAFTAGRVRVKGNMAKLVASQPALAEVGAVFDDLRQATTYEP